MGSPSALHRIDPSLPYRSTKCQGLLRCNAAGHIFEHYQVLFVGVDDCQRLEHVGTCAPV